MYDSNRREWNARNILEAAMGVPNILAVPLPEDKKFFQVADVRFVCVECPRAFGFAVESEVLVTFVGPLQCPYSTQTVPVQCP